MELVNFVQEMMQCVAEYAVSYRLGQNVVRAVDRVLWTIEKSARWAVPPPLDQDERPQPELIRPLPWVFFLSLLVFLRITRESISLINLVLGKPPLRSADVVAYIQSKRRYIRTLKYQGSRMMRARSTPSQPTRSWCSSLQSLFEFTMCFRRQGQNYGNNNTTRVSNNDEVLIVKCNKRDGRDKSPGASTVEISMERLIEKMMVDLQADSDDDSSYTVTNPTSANGDQSNNEVEADQHQITQNDNAKRQFNDTNETDVPKPTNEVDKLKHEDRDKYVVDCENSEIMRINTTSSEVSAKIETDLLLQSERNYSQHRQQSTKIKRVVGKRLLK
ncbi:uncharacterized protein Jabba [Battus philenor]|uniref:uncharacterized protein Jabba n=1 Tax=Battus philenor TaxID=42288 RepID=UPI0035CECF2C